MQIHVVQARARCLGLDVGQQPEHPGHRPGTPISVVQSSGTSVNPSNRAAYAGNSASRSGVAVKMTLIRSSGVIVLRCMTALISSVVPSRIASREFSST